MAVTITDRRTIVDQADSTTGWTGAGFGTTTTDFAEGGAAVAQALNIATGQVYFTNGTGIDLSNTLVYIWLFNNALQNSWTTGATSMLLGDGTDRIAFHLAGGDRDIFKHLEGPVNWKSAVLDGSRASAKNTAGETTAVAGSFAGLNLASITQFGGHFITQSKALGGGYNVAVDIIRYGNLGIYITGGGSTTKGKCSEIAAADRNTGNLSGHGVFRQLQPIAFGCQAPLTFGNSGITSNSYFSDTGVSIIFEAWDVGNDKYFFNVEGNASATNSFELTNSTIATAGPYVTMSFASGDINTLTFDGVVFSQLGNTITFSNKPDSSGHSVKACTFDRCGQIDPGKVTFENNTISNTTNTGLGAVVLDADGSSKWKNLTFISSGSGHAVYATTSGYYTFDGFTFTNYGSTGTTNAALYNNSGGNIVINVTNNGDSPTYRNGTSATTEINNAVNINLTNIIGGSRVYIYDQTNSGVLYNEISATSTFSKVYNYLGDTDILIRVRNASNTIKYKPYENTGTITSNGFSLNVNQVIDG